MYAAQARVVRRTTLVSFFTFFAIGIALLLIAGTVTLALIPVYTSRRSITVNPNVLTSKESTLIVAVEKNHTFSSGRRRRRAIGDLAQYTPGVFTPDGVQMVENKLSPFVVFDGVSGMNIINISIDTINQKRRKRFAITKRQTYASDEVVLKIKFRILFLSTCLSFCQTKVAPMIQTKLYNSAGSLFNFDNVPIMVNGTLQTAAHVVFVEVLYVPTIIPGLSSTNTATTPVFNINSATSAPIG